MREYRQDAVQTTRQELIERLERYMPDTDQRAYYRWALSDRNPDRKLFSRIIALTQLGNLTAAMLTGLQGRDDWPILLRHAIPVNLYQIFEVVSDNLGIGLAAVRSDEQSDVRDLVLEFNAVAADDLRHPTGRPATELLADLRPHSAHISSFDQSLTSRYQAQLVDRYLATTRLRLARGVLERTVWSGLVANLESGRDVLAAIAGTRGEPLVRAKTVERYRAVDRTLLAQYLSRDDLVDTGRQAILVAPTLGYFATVFGEISHTDPGYLETLADGTLVAAFDTASLIVRLQNDIGTPLLLMSRQQRSALVQTLRLSFAVVDTHTAIDLLTRAADHPVLNRFRKDLLNGEFNICLYDLYRIDDIDEGLAAFMDGLDYFADLYARHRTLLHQQLDDLDCRLHDRRITEVTRRFVAFHEKLYSHRYDTLVGDYAI
ncbi:hypothetical protein OH799_00940 [Nocardia sp. NBC_00881]|uniref:hypothetical protein n=1 Tax=Nocardia sp. NBC_00881 TaxID=2975995 RepID=UPI0038675C69|nr:hypothetical protein OH799_00940 [Nocardia sp. NBC_00881]